MSDEQMLTETACHLKEFLASNNVMGSPVDFGEKVVIPVARFGFGFVRVAARQKMVLVREQVAAEG